MEVGGPPGNVLFRQGNGRASGSAAAAVLLLVTPSSSSRFVAKLRAVEMDVLDQDGTNREIPVDRAGTRQ